MVINSRIKILLTIALIASSFIVNAQTHKSSYKKQELDYLTVSYIEITPLRNKKANTKAKKLSKIQTQEFIKTWNKTIAETPCGTNFTYVVSVYFQDYSKKEFFLEKSKLSDNKTNCLDTKDSNYADKLFKGK
ncbi:MAG: hypothetical protein ABI851_00400 [Saprospiraceae bacterium]